jgi:hypothetical protein
LVAAEYTVTVELGTVTASFHSIASDRFVLPLNCPEVGEFEPVTSLLNFIPAWTLGVPEPCPAPEGWEATTPAFRSIATGTFDGPYPATTAFEAEAPFLDSAAVERFDLPQRRPAAGDCDPAPPTVASTGAIGLEWPYFKTTKFEATTLIGNAPGTDTHWVAGYSTTPSGCEAATSLFDSPGFGISC